MEQPFIVFIENVSEYDALRLKGFIDDTFGKRARVCLAENIYENRVGDNPNPKRTKIGQRAIRLL